MEHTLEFTYEGGYSLSGPITKETRQIWFTLHGYGQLARYFIRKFSPLENHGIVVVAPEGLSHFYLEEMKPSTMGTERRVGAAWMTKENRARDIQNYLTFLNRLYEVIIPKGNKIPVTLFGFSQGAATAARWVTAGQIQFQNLILWAGLFPPDLDIQAASSILQNKKVSVVCGRQDPYLTDFHLEQMKKISAQTGVFPEIVFFEGGHEIEPNTLLSLAVVSPEKN